MAKGYYYNNRKNVEDYIKMAEPYDGKLLIEKLRTVLKPESTILELGMGPGKDLDYLSRYFRVTGSDLSTVFIERYKSLNPNADVCQLDALTILIDKYFDCIYSNKVLHHLTQDELSQSLKRQAELLNPSGIVMHTFWEGNREEILSGLRFVYYPAEKLKEVFSKYFYDTEIEIYSEMYPDDSIMVLGRKKHN